MHVIIHSFGHRLVMGILKVEEREAFDEVMI